jgi:proline dehydrogenase
MGVMRNILLWASANPVLKEKVPRLKFVRKALKRFMPGERPDDAIAATKIFQADGIPTVFTQLGENVVNLFEADEVRNHYLNVIEKIAQEKLDVEVSIKLTQLGFDLSEERTYENFKEILLKAKTLLKNTVWIDMEGSAYTQRTIDFYKKIKSEESNTGLCLQSYLFSTHEDLNQLMGLKPEIRLVKGAYKEPPDIALKDKIRVDENYLDLSQKMLAKVKEGAMKAVFGTHDLKLIDAINKYAQAIGLEKTKYEFHMLYGIKTNEQIRLAREGYKVRILISYGSAWYPWYVRRLAERPANITFVLKNIFSG